MSESKRIIGSSKVRKDRDTGTYSIEYYVQADDLATYMASIGDIAEWAPDPARVSFVDKTELANDRWIISIEAEPDATAVPGSITEEIDILDQFEWKYKSKSFYYKPLYWGVRQATEKDIAKASGGIKVKNIAGDDAQVNDWIFMNFLKDTAQLKGYADYSNSVFDKSSHPNIKYLNQNVPTDIFEVTFYSDETPKNLKNFNGINGKFPSDYEVYNGNVAGKWCMMIQKLESVQKDGETYVKVFRRFVYAWGGKWNGDLFGGTWGHWEKG